MEDSSNPHETNICQKKPRWSLFVKKFNFTESGIFEIFMEGNWKSMSGSISIQSCSSNIISKSHNLARKTRGESFSIFCCSCWLRLAYQACLPQHRLEYPHKRNWILALYKVCNIAPCQKSNRKTSLFSPNLQCSSFVWMKALLVFAT